MTYKYWLILNLLFTSPAWARSVIEDYLGKALKNAEHMVVGQLYKVEMFDKENKPVTNPSLYVSHNNGFKIIRYYRLSEHLKGKGAMPTTISVEDGSFSKSLEQEQLKVHQMEKIYFFNKNWHVTPGQYEFPMKEKGIALSRWKYQKEY